VRMLPVAFMSGALVLRGGGLMPGRAFTLGSP